MNELLDDWKQSVDKCKFCGMFLCPTHWWQMMVVYYVTMMEKHEE